MIKSIVKEEDCKLILTAELGGVMSVVSISPHLVEVRDENGVLVDVVDSIDIGEISNNGYTVSKLFELLLPVEDAHIMLLVVDYYLGAIPVFEEMYNKIIGWIEN